MNRKLDSPLLGALLLNFHYLEGVDFIVGGLYGLRSYCIMDLWVLWLDLHCFVTGVTASFPGISVFSIPLDYLSSCHEYHENMMKIMSKTQIQIINGNNIENKIHLFVLIM